MSKSLSYLAGRKGVDKTLFEELGIAATENGTPFIEPKRESVAASAYVKHFGKRTII